MANTSQHLLAPADRSFLLHEHHGMKILQDYEIKVPPFGVALDAKAAFTLAKNIGGRTVFKAQVIAGYSEKGRFSSGLQGGIHVLSTPNEVKKMASQMIGAHFITDQTDHCGKKCEEVMVCKRLLTRRKYYFSITLDRNTNGPIVIASSQGGVNIEEVAATNPDSIVKVQIDIALGITKDIAHDIATKMGFSKDCEQQASEIIQKLYKMFRGSDATLVEINPMAEDVNEDVYCINCKLHVDCDAVVSGPEIATASMLCSISGQEDAGTNYGVISCSACSRFYKRTTDSQSVYMCKFTGTCAINVISRTGCKHCRYEKCISEGMRISAPQQNLLPTSSNQNSTESAEDDNSRDDDVDESCEENKGEVIKSKKKE